MAGERNECPDLFHRERPRCLADLVAHPGASVLGRIPAQKRTPHAVGDQMEGTTAGIIDKQATGEGHAKPYGPV